MFIRDKLRERATELGLAFTAPPLELCTDNGAMIAWAGHERLTQGFIDKLDAPPRPRWPLETELGTPVHPNLPPL